MSHYDWVEAHINIVAKALGCKFTHEGASLAHGDKCYSAEALWSQNSVPFPAGVLLYCLSRDPIFKDEVRQTLHGWVNPHAWVVGMYHKHKSIFEELQ